MMCQPNSVCTGPTMSPALAANAASSNALTIVPRANVPRSPPCCAEPGSFENSRARSPNFAGLAFALASNSSACFFAAARSASLASGFTAIRMCATLRSSAFEYCCQVGVVLFLHVGGIDRHPRQQRIRRQDQVLDLGQFRRLERRLVLVVERLHRGVIDLDVLDERRGIDHGDGDLALLLEQPEELLGGRACDDVRRGDRLLHRGGQHVLAHLFLEREPVRVLPDQEHFVAFRRELAPVLERRDGRDHVPQLRVGNAETLVPGLGRSR